VSVTVEDEIVRTMLQAFAHSVRVDVGCPVLLVIGANITGSKIIVGADIDGDAVPMTVEAAAEVVRRICSKIAETERPNDVKLYGEGHDS
jgi:hypothetical protein